jgi:hypothetical protein
MVTVVMGLTVLISMNAQMVPIAVMIWLLVSTMMEVTLVIVLLDMKVMD